MLSLLSELAQEINNISSISLCAKCTNNEDLKRLTTCGHLICVTCFNSAASKCPICRAAIQRNDSLPDNNLQDILTNISTLSKITNPKGEIDFNFECPEIKFFFAPESAINKRDHKGETRLHKECRDGNLDKVEALLQTGLDVNIQDFAGWTALHEAVTANKLNVVKLLLDYGAFVSVPGLNYMTPLHVAVEENNIPVVKLLVEYGADLMCFNKDGKIPMDLGGNYNDIRNALCLTPRRTYMYKVYTIPQLKVFLMNVDKDDAQFRSLPGVSLTTERNFLNAGDATYVVCGNNKPKIKYLQAAILQESCIVTRKWMDDFIIKKFTINPMDYIPNIPGYALNKAMMNMFNKLPKLFDGLHFYFYHTNLQKIGGFTYTVEDFKMFVRLGGGKIITRRPTRVEDHDLYYPYHADKNTKAATVTYYLIYDETKRLATETQATGMQYKSAKWLIECINNFSII